VTGTRRAEAMARRLLRTASRLGVDPRGLDLLRGAFQVGMAPRHAAALDDHHPDFLHPARTALILMDDVRVATAGVLAAALVTETRDPTLRPHPRHGRTLGAAWELAAEVPDPHDVPDRLLEALVTASHDARLVAGAERLDHARHLHLRSRAEWEPYHTLTRDVYTPVAHRTSPALAGRLTWWCATFQERFLGG
jgi:hypothetical protein